MDPDSPERRPETKDSVLKGLLRWLITALLCGLYYPVIRLYEGRTLSPGAKYIFDWIVIGLSVLVGLNMASSYKEIERSHEVLVLPEERRRYQRCVSSP